MGSVNPSGKERVDEMQARARKLRATTMLESIKRRGEAVRNMFAHGSCDICDGPIVRYERDRGVICAAGHTAKISTSIRRLESARAERMSTVNREHEMLEARMLQSKRRRGQL